MTNPVFSTPLIAVDWLAEHLDHPQLLLLDATLDKPKGIAPDLSHKGHIPGSRFFDIKQQFSDSSSALPNTLPSPKEFTKACRALGINKDSWIVVYDKWGIYSSPRAWWMFKAMGHDKVAVLNGGLPAWLEAGHKVVDTYSEALPAGNFVSDFNSNLVNHVEDVIQAMQKKEALILDARSSGRFHASVPEPRAELRGGHIPGSKSLPYSEVIKDGKMKSKAELQAIFSQANAQAQPIICSCGSGVTASVLYLAAYLAGQKQIAVYDGSWTDWAQRLDLPVEP